MNRFLKLFASLLLVLMTTNSLFPNFAYSQSIQKVEKKGTKNKGKITIIEIDEGESQYAFLPIMIGGIAITGIVTFLRYCVFARQNPVVANPNQQNAALPVLAATIAAAATQTGNQNPQGAPGGGQVLPPSSPIQVVPPQQQAAILLSPRPAQIISPFVAASDPVASDSNDLDEEEQTEVENEEQVEQPQAQQKVKKRRVRKIDQETIEAGRKFASKKKK